MRLHVGQTFNILNGPTITYSRIISNDLCPPHAKCVWEGSLTIELIVDNLYQQGMLKPLIPNIWIIPIGEQIMIMHIYAYMHYIEIDSRMEDIHQNSHIKR